MSGKRVVGDLLRAVYQHVNYHTVTMPDDTADTKHAHSRGKAVFPLPPQERFPQEKHCCGRRKRGRGAGKKVCAWLCILGKEVCGRIVHLHNIHAAATKGLSPHGTRSLAGTPNNPNGKEQVPCSLPPVPSARTIQCTIETIPEVLVLILAKHKL